MNLVEMAQALNINRGSVISVVGCGGKTTLIERLAEILADDMKVGVATTTKMYIPRKGTYDDIFIRGLRECRGSISSPGIYYFADEMIPGKIHGFGSYMAAQAKAYMDVILIEADGSSKKPLKGWASYEPVIIDDTTLTIGVLTLKELGNVVTDDNVHRVQEFERLTGASKGDLVQVQHLQAMVNETEGMFRGSKSKKVLLINQIDTKEEYRQAVEFVNCMPLNIDAVFISSVINDYVHIHKKKRQLKVAAVVLAAGLSKRMERNKLLIEIGGHPVIEYALNCITQPNLYERHVVTAYEEVAELCHKYSDIHVIMNDAPHLGQGHSVVLGTENCSNECDGIMFFASDMPYLKAATVRELLDAFDENNKIIVPLYDGVKGNPVVFPVRFKEDLLRICGDTGGRQIAERYPDQVVYVPVADGWQGMDIDTPADLEKLEAVFSEN